MGAKLKKLSKRKIKRTRELLDVQYPSSTSIPITTTATEFGSYIFMDEILPQSSNEDENIMETLSELDEKEMYELGYSLNDLVMDCRYAGYTCDERYELTWHCTMEYTCC